MAEPEKTQVGKEGQESTGDSQVTFAERYPNLAKLVLVTWPWGEPEDRWLEYLTGEPQGDRRGARDPDL